ncbi:MAG: hypothetical protein Q9M92_14130 [Enterobacterales bacterium]|nr:hypothetical protein [Enterobacterales bacterium]
MDDLAGTPKPHTVAVDQKPCSSCAPKLADSGVDKVIVPMKPGNPGGSPKSAARAAAEKGKPVVPREIKIDDKTK